MAITIEQEKQQKNWVGITVALIVVVSLFIAAYYLFFKRPELVEVATSGQFKQLQGVSQITFNPETLFNSPQFKALRQFGGNITTPTPGRANPFVHY